jgi:LPS export ABC transporter protein LptC
MGKIKSIYSQEFLYFKSVFYHAQLLHATVEEVKFDCRKCLLYGTLALPSGRPTIEIQGFHLVESQGERRSVEMTAQNAQVYRNQNISALEDLRAFMWGKFKKPFEASGKLGLLDTETQDIEVREEARLLSPDGYLFETKSFHYDSKSRNFEGKELVTVEKANTLGKEAIKMTGTGFNIDLEKSAYSINKNVNATQALANGEILTVKSNSVQMDSTEKTATFLKKVNVKSPQIEMRGERLVVSFSETQKGEADKPSKFLLDSPADGASRAKKISATIKQMNVQSKGLAIEFAPDGTLDHTEAIGEVDAKNNEGMKMKAERLITKSVNGVNTVYMRGKVQIETNNRTATCEEAEYLPDTGNVLLKTVAAVRNDQQILEGDVIRFSTKNSEVVVDKARGKVNKEDLGLR